MYENPGGPRPSAADANGYKILILFKSDQIFANLITFALMRLKFAQIYPESNQTCPNLINAQQKFCWMMWLHLSYNIAASIMKVRF